MKEILLQKGTFIVVPFDEPKTNFWLTNNVLDYEPCIESDHFEDCVVLLGGFSYEIIGLVSEILKDEEKAEKIITCVAAVNSKGYYFQDERNDRRPFKFSKATASFQSLCTKYELKDTDLLIKKI